MGPTLSPFERRTGVPSTFALAINVAVSRLSTADCVAIVVLLLLQPHGVNAAAKSRVPRAARSATEETCELTLDDDPGIAQAFPVHQREQGCGIRRMQPHAAVPGAAPICRWRSPERRRPAMRTAPARRRPKRPRLRIVS